MATEIGKVKGYSILYDPRLRRFQLVDADVNIVGEGETQKEVEDQADKLAKTGFHFPIQAFMVVGGSLQLGRITSLNISDHSVFFVSDETNRFGGNRQKVRLGYGSRLYEATEANKELAIQVAQKQAQIKEIEEENSVLLGTLQKPIGSEYFKIA